MTAAIEVVNAMPRDTFRLTNVCMLVDGQSLLDEQARKRAVAGLEGQQVLTVMAPVLPGRHAVEMTWLFDGDGYHYEVKSTHPMDAPEGAHVVARVSALPGLPGEQRPIVEWSNEGAPDAGSP